MDVLVALQRCRGPTEDKDHKTIQRSSSSVVVGYESQFFLSKHVLDTGATDSGDLGSGCNNGFVEYQPNKKQTPT